MASVATADVGDDDWTRTPDSRDPDFAEREHPGRGSSSGSGSGVGGKQEHR